MGGLACIRKDTFFAFAPDASRSVETPGLKKSYFILLPNAESIGNHEDTQSYGSFLRLNRSGLDSLIDTDDQSIFNMTNFFVFGMDFEAPSLIPAGTEVSNLDITPTTVYKTNLSIPKIQFREFTTYKTGTPGGKHIAVDNLVYPIIGTGRYWEGNLNSFLEKLPLYPILPNDNRLRRIFSTDDYYETGGHIEVGFLNSINTINFTVSSAFTSGDEPPWAAAILSVAPFVAVPNPLTRQQIIGDPTRGIIFQQGSAVYYYTTEDPFLTSAGVFNITGSWPAPLAARPLMDSLIINPLGGLWVMVRDASKNFYFITITGAGSVTSSTFSVQNPLSVATNVLEVLRFSNPSVNKRYYHFEQEVGDPNTIYVFKVDWSSGVTVSKKKFKYPKATPVVWKYFMEIKDNFWVLGGTQGEILYNFSP
jgi:hypothetical protein